MREGGARKLERSLHTTCTRSESQKPLAGWGWTFNGSGAYRQLLQRMYVCSGSPCFRWHQIQLYSIYSPSAGEALGFIISPNILCPRFLLAGRLMQKTIRQSTLPASQWNNDDCISISTLCFGVSTIAHAIETRSICTRSNTGEVVHRLQLMQ